MFRQGGERMKIKIITEIPVSEFCQPVVGEIYEVIEETNRLFYIEVNGTKVGVYLNECEVIE